MISSAARAGENMHEARFMYFLSLGETKEKLGDGGRPGVEISLPGNNRIPFFIPSGKMC